MSTKIKNRTPIQTQTRVILLGCIVFILMGLLNILFRFTPMVSTLFPKLLISGDPDQIMFVFRTIGYVLYSITFASLIPIGIGIRNITDVYFVDHITKSGQQTATWIFIYSASVLLDMLSLGWPVLSGFVAIALIAGRVMAFVKINKTFEKINRIFDVKVGSVVYILFAYYSIIIMVLGAVANYASDLEFEVYLAIFNGVVESVLMMIVGSMLILDVFRIKNFLEKSNIQPYSAKKAYLSKDRTDKPVLSTTKDHIQSTTQIEKFQRSAAKQEMRIQKLRARETAKRDTKEREVKKDEQITYITCHQCNERTDKNLSNCMNCGESLKDELSSMKKETSDISVRRILSPKKEKILQQLTAAAFLIAFVVYSFVSDNADAVLQTYSWIIIALFATYLFVNYIVLFFSGKGYAVTTVLSDGSFLFIIVPVLCAIFSYFMTLIVAALSETDIEENRWLLIGLTIILSLLCIFLLLNYKIKKTDMNFKEYIQYRLDFKARAEELNKEQKRVEKKRENFDSLDRIEANMAKQRQEKVMDYEDFDFKQRLKDLGSPLTNDEED